MSGKQATATAIAGVGKPIKPAVWRTSMLNFARRSAANIAKNKPDIAHRSAVVWRIISNINTAGKAPKVTMSANESNCLPMGEYVLVIRATNPSKKSNTKPLIIR